MASPAPVNDTHVIDANMKALDDRDCRIVKSKYFTANPRNRPPCIHHPEGTLKYQFHDAYNHLESGTASRKNTHAVLLGYYNQPEYNILTEFMRTWFDENRNVFLGLKINSPEAEAPRKELKDGFVAFIGKRRMDCLWYMKETSVYVELALTTFICDSHFTWMRSSSQQNSLSRPIKLRRTEEEGYDENVFDVGGRCRSLSLYRTSSKKGATLSTAIEVDDEDDTHRRVSERLSSTPVDVIRPGLSRTIAASSRSTNDVPNIWTPLSQAGANVDTSSLPALHTAYVHLLNDYTRLSKSGDALLRQHRQLQADFSDANVQCRQLKSDNAALGVALAQQTKPNIRKSSQRAIIHDLARDANVSFDVTERLMENKEFIQKWFS